MEETTHIEAPHSVKFSINAKGNYAAEVKCYGKTPEDAMKAATAQASIAETLIKEKNGGA